ncbi:MULTISPECIES: chemotaxis protein CheW [Pseudomonas]|nr:MULTISPECIES: chemotaxis protein CheW [Pseudomonas]
MKTSLLSGCSLLAGYRVGSTYCLSPSISISSFAQVPPMTALYQLPGTKPWVLGAAKNRKDLTAYFNFAQFLGLPNTDSRDQKTKSSPALILEDITGTGSFGLKVEELLGLIHISKIEDVEDSDISIPMGFGSCFCGTVKTEDRVWALIDLYTLAGDERLHKIDLT